MVELSNFWFALSLTALAGLSTGIGSLIALYAKRTNTSFLSISLGFSAGVMIYISFVELFSEARKILSGNFGGSGEWTATLMFFAGFAVFALIDKLIPNYENPHEMHKVEEMRDAKEADRFRHLYRVGVLMVIAIGIHNFPEGMVTFLSSMADSRLGIAVAVAVAIHNIPEGIAVSVPIFYATGSRKKAFIYSFLSGLSEPAGGILGYFLLKPFISDAVIGMTFAGIAGMMVFISFDSLLPSAEKYGRHHLAILGLVLGMVVMAASLLLSR
ncbi:MAG: zinc transporter ZupT [Victivallaceae bacterium]|nr:zinc transporter ZupT [Victivallaceae bacterium]